jgi:hypothetical protein
MKVDISCSNHPRYKAISYPVSCCHACQALYWLKHDGFRCMPDESRLVDKDEKNRKTRKKP